MGSYLPLEGATPLDYVLLLLGSVWPPYLHVCYIYVCTDVHQIINVHLRLATPTARIYFGRKHVITCIKLTDNGKHQKTFNDESDGRHEFGYHTDACKMQNVHRYT